MRDPNHLLLAFNSNPTEEEGPGYVYAWRDDWLTSIANGTMENSHDIQWEVRGPAEEERPFAQAPRQTLESVPLTRLKGARLSLQASMISLRMALISCKLT